MRLGTRGSPLAVIQARAVAKAIQTRHPSLRVELEIIQTHGDEGAQNSLGDVPGKAIFTQRIEEALVEGRIDAAVHSLKDLPEASPQGLVIAAVPHRESPEDAFLSLRHRSIGTLPPGAVIATSSARRAAQLRHFRPDLRIEPLAGNVGTRVRKLRRMKWDGIVLATAGLNRLGLQGEITEVLPRTLMLPAPGQGALAIQAVRGTDAHHLLQALDDAKVRSAVDAERAFAHRLGGDCNVPVAALARVNGEELELEGCVASMDGTTLLRETMTGPKSVPTALGEALANRMLACGAQDILEAP